MAAVIVVVVIIVVVVFVTFAIVARVRVVGTSTRKSSWSMMTTKVSRIAAIDDKRWRV